MSVAASASATVSLKSGGFGYSQDFNSQAATSVTVAFRPPTVIQGTGYGADFNEVQGLLLGVAIIPTLQSNGFDLVGVGSKQSFSLGAVDIVGESDIALGETDNLNVTLSIEMRSPFIRTLTIFGEAVAVVGPVSDPEVDYSLTWNPVVVDFGDGTGIRFSIIGSTFSVCCSQSMNAEVELVSTVPESSSSGLILLGLAGLATATRRRYF